MPDRPKANRGPVAGPENRRALIAAAREVFADSGYSAPLSAVAKKAGVGQGSLYRHFPDRVSLAVAVFDENIGELEILAADPVSTLDNLLDRVIEQALVSKVLIDLITVDPDDERIAHLGTRLAAVVETVVERERAAGRIRSTVAADDVFLAVSMVAGLVARVPAAGRREIATRAWALFHTVFQPDPGPGW